MTKPSEFFVGVLDLFAIILPGGIAVAILEPKLNTYVLGPLISSPSSDMNKWVIFLILAYFLGHLIFMAGSYIDLFYNFLRERFNPYGNESAYQCATRVRDKFIKADERQALNTFQWSRSLLIQKCPAAASDVHRLEADSKFFRSLLVICIFSATLFTLDEKYIAGVVSSLIAIPCFMRYYERRLKSTTQAYIHIVSMYRHDTFCKSNEK